MNRSTWNSSQHYATVLYIITIVLASFICAGAELRGCQGGHCPLKIFALPQWPPQNFPRDVMSLHWSPTQTIDSYPCCKTGPSSGPPKRKCLAPPLHVCMLFNNNTRLCLFNVTMLTRFACIVFCYQSISLHSCIWVPLIVIVMYA